MNRHSATARSLSLAVFNGMLDDAPEDERWELVGGHLVRMMVGARIEHARIVSNLNGELRQRLRMIGSPCWVLAETFRVETDDASLMPDILVNCGPVAAGSTKLKSPSVVMEVLSRGTADRDRGAKWAAYQTIDTLRHYALVRCDTPSIDLYDRGPDGAWAGRRMIAGRDAVLDLPALGVAIPFSEIYFGVFG